MQKVQKILSETETDTQRAQKRTTGVHLQGWQLEYVHLGLQWMLGWQLALSAHWGAVRVQEKWQTRDWREKGKTWLHQQNPHDRHHEIQQINVIFM